MVPELLHGRQREQAELDRKAEKEKQNALKRK